MPKPAAEFNIDYGKLAIGVEHALMGAAADGADFAQDIAPVVTGTYRGSIVSRPALDEDWTYIIGTENVAYAVDVENRHAVLEQALAHATAQLTSRLRDALEE